MGSDDVRKQITSGMLPLDSRLWCITDDAFAQVCEVIRSFNLAAASTLSLRRSASMEVINEVAIIDVRGVLMKYPSILQLIFGGSSTLAIQAAVESAARSDQVRAILLMIDSPGGQAAGIAELADAVFAARSRKPVVAQISGLAASAAYWVASQASSVYSQRMDLVGSIGTRMLVMDLSKLYEREGIEPVVIKSGEYKAVGLAGSKVTERHKSYLQTLVDSIQQEFSLAVGLGRGMAPAKVRELADGRVHIARDALRLGLVDAIQTEQQTLAELLARFRTSPKKPVQMTDQELRAAWLAAVKQATNLPCTMDRNRVVMAENAGEARAKKENPDLWREVERRRGSTHMVQAPAPPPAAEPPSVRFNQEVAALMSGGRSRRDALAQVIRSNPRGHREWLAEINERANRPAAAKMLLAQSPRKERHE
jgi:signal peptide peptidase SppA